MKISDNVLNFAQGKTDVYEAFADYFNHYRATVLKKENVSYNNTLSFDEKSVKMHEALKAEIAKVANVPNFEQFPLEVWATNPSLKWATFAVIGAMVDMILPETIIDSIGIYTDVRTGGYGDSFAFDVKPRDLFVVSQAGRGKRKSEVHKQFEGQVTVTPVEHDVTVQVSLYKVLAGKENLADFALKAARSIESQMTLDSFNTFNTAMAALPTSPVGGELLINGYSQSTAVGLAQRVTAFNQGQKAVFLGTQLAVQSVLPSNSNYRYDLDSDYVKFGYVQTAFGYDVMILPQIADWTTPFKTLLDDKKIYVLSPSSQKLVKLCIEGALMTVADGVYDNANLTQNTTMKKNWQTAVATNAIAATIILP